MTKCKIVNFEVLFFKAPSSFDLQNNFYLVIEGFVIADIWQRNRDTNRVSQTFNISHVAQEIYQNELFTNEFLQGNINQVL